MNAMQQTERILRRLRVVRIVALFDLVLLIILVSAALIGQKDVVHIIGPLHGINFLLLLVIVGVAAVDSLWGWWFPVLVLLTAGPPGALIGEWLIHRRVKAQEHIAHHDLSPETTISAPQESIASSAVHQSVATDERKERPL